MNDLLQILLSIQRRNIHGVWVLQQFIEEAAFAMASGQQLDASRIASLTQQLKQDEVEIKAAVEAAQKV